jgi:Na+/H+-dicarboxylate symporter
MLFATMKLWLKYAFGIIMGAVLYIALPPSMVHGTAAISFLAEISLKIGGYALILTLAAGIPISVFRLSESHRFSKIVSSALVFFIISLIIAAGIGLASTLIFRPAPLPLISDSGAMQSLDPLELIRSTFPSNIFSTFSGAATWFLPLALFMLAFGLALSHDPVMARPILPVRDVFRSPRISSTLFSRKYWESAYTNITVPLLIWRYRHLLNTRNPCLFQSFDEPSLLVIFRLYIESWEEKSNHTFC